MTGSRKQSTSQRLNKNRSSLGGAGRSFTSLKNRSRFVFSDPFSRINPIKAELEELKQDVSDLKSLAHENNYTLLKSKVDVLERENKRLRYNNNELSKQNKFLQVQTDDYGLPYDYGDYDDDEDDDLIRPKQEKKNKPSDEERAKVLLKALLKTLPEFELKEEETFKSDVNVEICRKLIPKLQKEMKAYNPTYEQVETWLQSIHRSKRNAYLKSNQSNHSVYDLFGFSVSEPAPKRQTKPKKRKVNNNFEDEVEEGAKSLMKALLKTYPYELTLRIEDTFRSQVNKDICEKLIPKLQEDVNPAYNLSHDQVDSWLQIFHRNKRNAYLKSDFMTIDDY